MRFQLLCLLFCVFSLLQLGCEESSKEGTRGLLEYKGFRLQVLDNSETISRAFAINSHGHVIGSREVADEKGFVLSNHFFFDDGKQSIDLGKLDGYTNAEVEALSDNGLAAGFASRPLGHPDGSLTALLWDTSKNKLVNLGHIDGDRASHAQGISADGKKIVGYSTGREPERLRPCLWQYSEDKQKWIAEPLPTLEDYNPYTMSSSVVISPNGKLIATCITESFEEQLINSSLYLWKENDQGEWEREKVHDEQLYLSHMNDRGDVVGDIRADGGKRAPVVIRAEGKLERLALLPNTDSGNAYGINNDGAIVGVCNDPPGPDGGPHPFIVRNGKLQALPLPKESQYCLVYDINDRGQVAGFADITLPDQVEVNPETGEEEPLVKALAFVWESTPTPQ